MVPPRSSSKKGGRRSESRTISGRFIKRSRKIDKLTEEEEGKVAKKVDENGVKGHFSLLWKRYCWINGRKKIYGNLMIEAWSVVCGY